MGGLHVRWVWWVGCVRCVWWVGCVRWVWWVVLGVCVCGWAVLGGCGRLC